ncbi:MAG: cytochrome bc complex cytochrome b subunit, partial [Burkholderiales bacterium]
RATTEGFLFYWVTPFLLVYWLLVVVSARFAIAKLIATVVVFGMIGGFFIFDAKFWGVVAMVAAVLVFFALPWIDQSPVKSVRYRPAWHMVLYALFVIAFVILGYFGIQAPSAVGALFSMVSTLVYFAFFMLMPWWSKLGEFKPVPERVTFAPH